MKPLRLLALAIAATAWCASVAFACDGAKTSAASAASCGTKSAGVKSASADACGSKSATTAVAASASKKTAHAAGADCAASGACPMSAEACKAMMASGACTAEMQAACAAKGAKSTKAASASMDCCATGAKGAKTAAAAGCGMHAMTAQMDCAVCADESACDDDVKATGARAQVVPLRNGSMVVYMLDSDENVRGLQAAVARHNGRVVAALQGDAKLCTACKKLRGALASGKLVREVVNVERGCQVLITSSDRSIVEQVHRCTNAQVASRTKS